MFSGIKTRIVSYFQQSDDTSLLATIKPIYLVLSALGLQPYTLKYGSRRKRLEAVHRSLYPNCLCAAAFLIFLLSFFAVHVQSILDTGKSFSVADVALTQLNYIMELLSLLIVCFVSYYAAYINGSKYIGILNGIEAARFTFLPNTYGAVYAQVRYLVVIGLPVIILIHLVVNSTRVDGFWKTFLVTVSFILPQLIQFCVLFHIRIVLLLICSLLRSITEAIEAYVPEKCTSNVKKVSPKECLPLTQIKAAYSDAFDITNNVNVVFAAPIVVTIASCFHAIISEGYILYHGLAGGTMSVHEVLNCSVWVMWQCSKMFIVGHAGNCLKNEGAAIGQSLHDIPVEKEGLRTMIEILNLSAQVSSQRTELTAYGYFPVDATMIYNMAGAAAMYFVILVQLDNRN